jgi:hypothetical protein
VKLRCDKCRHQFRVHPAITKENRPRKFLCIWCKNQARAVRKAARAARRKLKMDGVRDIPYPKTDWKKNRVEALSDHCECCGRAYTKEAIEHVHHLIAKRMAAKFGDCDAAPNKLSVDAECHGRLKALDNLILRNDWVGAVAKARALHVPLERLVAAARFYGFNIERLVPDGDA